MALTLQSPSVVTTLSTYVPEGAPSSYQSPTIPVRRDTEWSPVEMAFKLVEKTRGGKQYPDQLHKLLVDVQNGIAQVYMENDPRTFEKGQSALDVMKRYWPIPPKEEARWQTWWKSHGRHAVQLVQQFQIAGVCARSSHYASSLSILQKPSEPTLSDGSKYSAQDSELTKDRWYHIQHQMIEDVKQLQTKGSFKSLSKDRARRVIECRAFDDPPDVVAQFLSDARKWKDSKDFTVFVGNHISDVSENYWDSVPYDRNDLFHPNNHDALRRIQSGEEVALVTLDFVDNKSFYLTWCFEGELDNFVHLVRTGQIFCNEHVTNVLKQTHEIHLELFSEGDFFYEHGVVILLKALEDGVESYRDLRVPYGCNTLIDHSTHIQLSQGFSISAHNAVVFLTRCQSKYRKTVSDAHDVCQNFVQQVQGIPGVVLNLFATFEDSQAERCLHSMFKEIEKTERKFNHYHQQLSELNGDMVAFFQRYKTQVEEDWTIAQLQLHGANTPVPIGVQQAFDTMNSVDDLSAIPTEAYVEVCGFTACFQQHRRIKLKWSIVKEVRIVKTMIALGLWSLDLPTIEGGAETSAKSLKPPPSYEFLASRSGYADFTMRVRKFNATHPDKSKTDGSYFKEWYPSVSALRKRVGDLYRAQNVDGNVVIDEAIGMETDELD